MGSMDLLGGSDRGGLEDFAKRFDQGSPWDGFDDDEAAQRHRQVAEHLSPQDDAESARDVFTKLSPQQRREAGRMLSERARQHGIEFDRDDDGTDDRYEDPGVLGGLLGGLHGRQPGGLGQLLGSGGGGDLQKVILGGIAAMATKRLLRR